MVFEGEPDSHHECRARGHHAGARGARGGAQGAARPALRPGSLAPIRALPGLGRHLVPCTLRTAPVRQGERAIDGGRAVLGSACGLGWWWWGITMEVTWDRDEKKLI